MRPTVHIPQAELTRIASLASDYPDLETGGSFFGLWTHSGAPVVGLVTGPGANARHLPKAFYQDVSHMEGTHHVAWNRAGLQHIGEWHSHHGLGLAEPSSGDEQTIWKSIDNLNWPRFLLGICCFDPSILERVDIGLFLFEAADRTITPCLVRVTEGTSPLAALHTELPDGRRRPESPRSPEARVPTPEESEWFSVPAVATRLAFELKAMELLSTQTGAEVNSEVYQGAVYLEVTYPSGTSVTARLTAGFPSTGIEVEVDHEPQSIEWHPDLTFATLALGWFDGEQTSCKT